MHASPQMRTSAASLVGGNFLSWSCHPDKQFVVANFSEITTTLIDHI